MIIQIIKKFLKKFRVKKTEKIVLENLRVKKLKKNCVKKISC